MSREGTATVQTCPRGGELTAFNRGQLPLDKLEAIAEHLDSCSVCENSLRALQENDTLRPLLSSHASNVPAVDEDACLRLAARARAIPAEQLTPPTVADASVARRRGLALPAVFGPYLLLELLGEGGMGLVYKARQEALKRLVALKMVRAGIYAGSEDRARFQREGEAIARVHHPHVVQIFEFGECANQLFFSMELLEGGSLASKLARGPLPPRQAAELVRSLAGSVQAAHQQGVVHRDLKPANVLFAADGTVKITDFGLAKVLDDESSDTRSDAILGTPAYMAPEQARGEVRKIGPAADVYALGAILYECLTGQPPFRAPTRYQTLELVQAREPEPPSRRRPELARDLEAICLKCLHKEAKQRYASASALAHDLDRWLRGEPTVARPPRWPTRLGRCLRRRARVVSAAAVLLLLAVVVPAAVWYRDPQRPRRAIEAELANGHAQTLIGETGQPAWSDWCMGKETSTTSTARREPFSIHTTDVALLELVRDPQLERFRLRAEVRHERSWEQLGAAGLYVAHRLYGSSQGAVHYLVSLTFNDLYDEARQPPAWPAQAQWMRTQNQVLLEPRLLWEQGRWSGWEYRLSGSGQELFRAAGRGAGQGPWRSLSLRVTPEGIEGFWGETPVGRPLTQRELGVGVRRSLEQRRREDPAKVGLQGFEPEFTPRGALGLFVVHGSASFRRVVLEPLDSSP